MAKPMVSFGWQGISARVPADWELVGVPKTHDPNEGYLRLDDGRHPRFELKWQAHPQRKFDIEKTLDKYLDAVRKEYGKASGGIEIHHDPTLIPRSKCPEFFADREVLFFSWRGAYKAFGAIWRCKRCERVVLAQVLGNEGGLRKLAASVLESLQDHPEGETVLWTAYHLEFQTPRRFRLENTKFLNGYLLFSFSDGAQRLAVERYGLADQLLKARDLEEWFRTTYRKELRGTFFVLDRPETKAPVLILNGRDRRWIDRIDRWDLGASRRWDALFRRMRIGAYLWHDEAANRIYVIRVLAKQNALGLAEQVARSIPSFRHLNLKRRAAS
ncbi:MAG: hypothetical protein KatS3mg115_1481 [Candidatus Poribacteria bacterium]|nr:MAG: hypothetical protein KatS3mg115_1481 [Candidatus Poribacteria bacterium]